MSGHLLTPAPGFASRREIARPFRCGKVRRERQADPGIVITKTERLGRRAASPAD